MNLRRPSHRRKLVYDRLRERIASGQLPPGSLLVTSQLASALRTSRTPVREALLHLTVEGLVAETTAGLVVRELSEEEIMEVYEVRVPLESLAARLAASNATPFHLAQIQALHHKLASASQGRSPNVDDLAGLNVEFHRAICQAGRNALLMEFMSKIFDSIGRFRNTTFRQPGRLQEAVVEHAQLVAAIAGRDAEAAHEIARQHMERAMKVRLEMYRRAHASSFEPAGTDRHDPRVNNTGRRKRISSSPGAERAGGQ